MNEPTRRTTRAYGTYVHGGESRGYGEQQLYNHIVIPTGTIYPDEKSEIFTTKYDNQTSIDCRITEAVGNEENPEFSLVIADVILELPSGRPAGMPVKFTYNYTESQLMECTIVDLESGITKNFEVQVG